MLHISITGSVVLSVVLLLFELLSVLLSFVLLSVVVSLLFELLELSLLPSFGILRAPWSPMALTLSSSRLT